MKPIVGVMPLWDEEKNSIWMLPGYMDGITQAGGLPFIFPFTSDVKEINQLVDMCDGFLFTGGQDVSPEIYHEKTLDGLVVACSKRDNMESIVLDAAIKNDKPVLGICRGIQFINAKLGGSLYQDLPSQRPTDTEHHQNPPYDIPVHRVSLEKNSPIQKFLGKEELMVNSYHHQAVKDLAPALKIMAVSEDGLVEAVYKPDNKFLWAVQWHPEYSYKTDNSSRKIFKAFVEAMR